MGQPGHQREHRQNDRHRAAQADPGDEGFFAAVEGLERQQADHHRQRPREQDHPQRQAQGRQGDRQQVMGRDQQAQHQEHADLCQPGHAVEHMQNAMAAAHRAVADHQAAQVHGEETTAVQGVGQGEHHQAAGHHQDRVQAGGQVDAVDQLQHQPATAEADHAAADAVALPHAGPELLGLRHRPGVQRLVVGQRHAPAPLAGSAGACAGQGRSWLRRPPPRQLQHAGVDAHAAARHRVEVDIKGHLLVADPQAEQAADGAWVIRFADAQDRVAADPLEQLVTLALVELAARHGVPAICQKPFAPTLADAKAMVARAELEIAAAQGKLASDRVRQTSELANLQAVQATLLAERNLEQQRLLAQISAKGRTLSIAKEQCRLRGS